MIAALVLAAAAALPPPEAGTALRRYALIVGANDGGAARVRLRYAESDAKNFDHVLRELGGLAETDRLLVLSPDRAALLRSLETVRSMLATGRASGATTELLVYYSGHSDDRGLLLKEELLPYDELRQSLGGLPADVRIAILDSCASGELTRMKGGQRKPAFLVDSSNKVKGHAFLTSSTADEVSQESDRIGSSFFTHALVSGLRGAADTTGDGRVTLSEAYQFAFNETLARTEQTRGGAQHPSYDIQLVGSGDVVLTDLRETSAGLRIDKAVEGRVSIRDGAGQLVVELDKRAGRAMELALEPGTYQVMLDRGGQLARGSLQLNEGQREVLDVSRLTPMAGEMTASRGDAEVYPVNPITFGLLYLGVPHKTTNYAELNLLVGGTTRLIGGTFSGIGAWIDEDATGAQFSGVFNHEGTRLVGADFAGVANVTGGEVLGAQVAGVANVASGPVTGTQIAGVANVSPGRAGVWLAGVGNVTTSSATGLAMGGVFNWHHGEAQGAQVSGVFNFASKLQGAQLSVVNVGGDVGGAQIGVINVAGSATTQVGVLNFAREAEATVGLLSFVMKGTFGFGVWTGDTAPVNAGFKLGGKRVYSILATSWDPRPTAPSVAAWFGVGVHIPLIDKLWLDPDLGSGNVATGLNRVFSDPNGSSSVISKVRLNLGYSFFEHLSIVAGVSLNVLVRFPDSSAPDLGYGWVWRSSGSPTQVSIWPSPYIGLQI